MWWQWYSWRCLFNRSKWRARGLFREIPGWKVWDLCKIGLRGGGKAPRSMNSHEHAVASPNVRITNTRIDDGTISLWMALRNNNKCWIWIFTCHNETVAEINGTWHQYKVTVTFYWYYSHTFLTGVLFPFLFGFNILAYLGIFLDADKDNQTVTQGPVQDPLGFWADHLFSLESPRSGTRCLFLTNCVPIHVFVCFGISRKVDQLCCLLWQTVPLYMCFFALESLGRRAGCAVYFDKLCTFVILSKRHC